MTQTALEKFNNVDLAQLSATIDAIRDDPRGG